jgi:hypothetical protein
MEMWMIAVLFGLSLALLLTAKIAKLMDMRYKMFLHLGVLFCVAAGAPLVLHIILIARKDPKSLFEAASAILLGTVFELIASFSKGEVIPPYVPVKKPGLGRIARTAKEVANYLLMGFAFYFAARGPLPYLGQMSSWDMLACGFFAMVAIIKGFQSLFQRVEICGNGLWQYSTLKLWEAYESFSWTGITTDGLELRLQAKSADQETTPLMVRPEDREVVQKILEANLPDQLSGAHSGLNRRTLPRCVRVKRTRLRRFAWQIESALCWPAVVLLLVDVWMRNASLETFSGVGFVSIMITTGVNFWFWQSEIIEICKNGLLLGDKLRAWEQYECFFWKGETEDGVELSLPLKITNSITRLVVAPKDRAVVQQLLEVNLQDRSTDAEVYSRWSRFLG